MPDRERQDGGRWDPPAHEVVATGLRFGRVVARLIRPNGDDEIRPILLPEHDRVLEPSPEHRRGRAVVLGGAQDDDRVGPLDVAGVVVVRGAPHDDARRADRDERERETECEEGEDRVPANQAHRCRLTGADPTTLVSQHMSTPPLRSIPRGLPPSRAGLARRVPSRPTRPGRTSRRIATGGPSSTPTVTRRRA